MSAESGEGERQVNANIARLYVHLNQAQAQTKETRTMHKRVIGERREDFKNAVEMGDDGTDAAARAKLDATVMAWQSWEEAGAQRKMELHECLDRERKLKQALRHEMDNAAQLSLFGLEAPPIEPEETGTTGTVKQLRAQAKLLGVKGFSTMTKAQLVHAIAHSGQTPDEKETTNDDNETNAMQATG